MNKECKDCRNYKDCKNSSKRLTVSARMAMIEGEPHIEVGVRPNDLNGFVEQSAFVSAVLTALEKKFGCEVMAAATFAMMCDED